MASRACARGLSQKGYVLFYQLVEAVKDTGQLQENLIHYVGSENEKMRAEEFR